jgi:hypothetical protein
LRSSLNRHADQGAYSIDDSIFGLEGVAVGNDFGAFMNHADGRDEYRNVYYRPLRPTEAEGEGNQSVGGEMCRPVHDARESLASIWGTANCEKAAREQHGGSAGKLGDRRKGYLVQGYVG